MNIPTLLAFFIFCGVCEVTWTAVNVSEPILPSVYASDIAGLGFSTNWFKTKKPLSAYNQQNCLDVRLNGFSNLRLRCNGSMHNVSNPNSKFLNKLEKVVDHCLAANVTPIISWLNEHAEACATEDDRIQYITFWTEVAKKLKDKNYRLSFNLFTENGEDRCDSLNTSTASLNANLNKYKNWSIEAKAAIRSSGGNNQQRIIILTAPRKESDSLADIHPDIYAGDLYLMAEWHLYASGPNKDLKDNGKPSQKYWSGDGSDEDKQRVVNSILPAVNFTNVTNIPTIQGAWMPHDNKNEALNQSEIIAFGRYHALKLKEYGIPSVINVLDDYYKTKQAYWITELQEFQHQSFNMSLVIGEIKQAVGL